MGRCVHGLVGVGLMDGTASGTAARAEAERTRNGTGGSGLLEAASTAQHSTGRPLGALGGRRRSETLGPPSKLPTRRHASRRRTGAGKKLCMAGGCRLAQQPRQLQPVRSKEGAAGKGGRELCTGRAAHAPKMHASAGGGSKRASVWGSGEACGSFVWPACCAGGRMGQRRAGRRQLLGRRHGVPPHRGRHQPTMLQGTAGGPAAPAAPQLRNS